MQTALEPLSMPEPKTLLQLRAGQLAGAQRLDLCGGLSSFPREIFDLADSLEVLNLSGNALTSLPDDLPRLHRLRVIFASDNPFTSLPAVLGQCPQLEMVGFKSCQIRHVPAAALPPRLRWLILTDNQLTQLPDALGQRPQLQKLMLAGNALARLPDTLADSQRLELLRISANQFSTLPDWLLRLPRLAWLAIGGNPLTTEPTPPDATPIQWRDLQLQQVLGEGASGVIHQALHQAPGPAPARTVAVKLFKGAMTSDGWPHSELAACLAAGAHPHLIPVAGPLAGYHTAGLVMERIAPRFSTLAGPPSLASCSRDVYAPGTRFSPATIQRIARGAASAVAHLHARGLLHGDLYGHNLQCDLGEGGDGHCLLGDMGAAAFLPADPALAQALQRLEVRAFGCLLEELLAHADGPVPAAWTALRDACLQPQVAARPPMAQVLELLHKTSL